ncbi:hypothetical protein IW152_000938 [Coemansia sp. BCRC 34962]|nr:hypothetical protein IW152_000938 [Coemansia sp. BCRC 34962]
MDHSPWAFDELVQRALNGLPAEYGPDTGRQQRSPSSTGSRNPRARTFDDVTQEVVNGYMQALESRDGSQLSTSSEYMEEYTDNPRRSTRRRTQRVLLNVPPHESVSAPPMADRRISLRSLTSALNGSGNRTGSSNRADSVSSSSRRVSGTSRSSRSHKRRYTARSDSSSSPPAESVDSDLSVEVCIYTQGTAVPHNASPPSESTHTCFICSNAIDGDTEAVNAHIDKCLAQSTGSASVAPAQEPMVEYEWGGQRRVRATAMIEGGLVAAGIGHGSSASLHNDDDIDVDAEDETNFGAAQYSDSNLLFVSSSSKNSRRDDKAQQRCNPQFEEFAPPLDDATPEPSAFGQQQAPGGGSQLVIEALKARIHNSTN